MWFFLLIYASIAGRKLELISCSQYMKSYLIAAQKLAIIKVGNLRLNLEDAWQSRLRGCLAITNLKHNRL